MTDALQRDDSELRGRDGKLRLNAYYFGFDETGVVEIDRILSAVACAGKGYHHTEGWTEDRGEGVPTYAELIAIWAHEAARRFRELTPPSPTPREDEK